MEFIGKKKKQRSVTTLNSPVAQCSSAQDHDDNDAGSTTTSSKRNECWPQPTTEQNFTIVSHNGRQEVQAMYDVTVQWVYKTVFFAYESQILL